ncbi:hypothetical protein A7985_04090 [Pseudoalteromonas luteoviolacea]|uniref:Uncharacterized protein n=1 Tax=Pseudoalteromonas luteoviolacea TaxID=43657 RepID=A0A1C0TUZ4_9GAMM|nr:hypothetical protein A7985_04090 [Pseudoalteromonas luteoviolacea]
MDKAFRVVAVIFLICFLVGFGYEMYFMNMHMNDSDVYLKVVSTEEDYIFWPEYKFYALLVSIVCLVGSKFVKP